MAPQILMPALSPTMEEGKLAKWHVKVGDPVKSGDVIAEIETDKATMEVEAVDEGKISQLLVPEGAENVKVNTPIAVIDGEAEAAAAPPAVARQEAARAPAPVRAAETKAGQQQTVSRPTPVNDTAIPEGTEMVAMTVREALRDAMREEMKRNPDVFLIGEEVGQYQGAYK
ncbi:MAG TPA: biotin/lipoyl-containing protein, partial [Aestuariivirgaceae bacterium]|nr:biotin/lipoyl-containing protein [Aestuariivirgaceae bacterium]